MFSVSFIMNVSTHLMRDLIPHQVGGDALIRWSPSCGGCPTILDDDDDDDEVEDNDKDDDNNDKDILVQG